MSDSYAAVDLGASSGRVILGRVSPDTLDVREVHRFANEPVHLPDGLHWNVLGLYQEMCAGLRKAGRVKSIGIDSWAVDYGLVDEAGALLGVPYHYRDKRTWQRPPVPFEAGQSYEVTGLAELPFNTIYQLLAESRSRLDSARHLLMIPDLLGFWLTGEVGAERTNASTTGLYDVRARDWATSLIEACGLPRAIFPPIRDPGTVIGPLKGNATTRVVAVGSHDTASAVVAVPAADDRFAYISCGTWSLVGVELSAPVLTQASRARNFTNETGVGGSIRYLRNVMGLWLLQECQRAWSEPDVDGLLHAAHEATPFAALIDVDDPVFLAPGEGHDSMPSRIASYCDGRVPEDRGAFVRCILESLAIAHRAAVRDAVTLSGRAVDTVHVVGGGSRNSLLCQLTADACGLPLVAGPVEATAIGNLLIQSTTDGVIGSLAGARALVAATQPLHRYEPHPSAGWEAAISRVSELAAKRSSRVA